MSKKVNQYRTDYYKEIGAVAALAIILLFVYLTSLQNYEDAYVAPQEVTVEITLSPEEVITTKIHAYFPGNGEIMVAIAKAESRLNPNAVGYNCYYNGDTVYDHKVNGAVSKACKKSHRQYAFSVDCGVMQMNVKGQTCPTELFDVEVNIKSAVELSKRQGLGAWVAYKTKAHEKYLK